MAEDRPHEPDPSTDAERGSRADPASTLASAAAGGDREAAEALFVAVYDQLREIAQRLLMNERAGHMLQPTALVNEAYFRMVGSDPVAAEGTTHFRAIAVRAMGRVLVDHARHENRQKRGGGWRRVSLDVALMGEDASAVEPLVLKEALEAMARADPRMAQVVQLRIFGDLTTKEIAAFIGVSTRQVERDWAMGRAWLRRHILEEEEDRS
ncbi:MAG: ECF-type sigma factor [Phycisphaerales bacterium]